MKPWHLVADIGGSNARFAVADPVDDGLYDSRTYAVGDYPALTDALSEFVKEMTLLGWASRPNAACLALACPVERDVVAFTNSDWVADRQALSTQLQGCPVTLINDFAAVGYAVTALDASDWVQLGGEAGQPNRPIAVLGPGTGLGVCSVIQNPSGTFVIEGEGGHADIAPVTDREVSVLRHMRARFGRVSIERALSGDGLLNIFDALVEDSLPAGSSDAASRGNLRYEDPARLTEAALGGTDPLAVTTVETFCEILGAVAGNLALTLGAKGGVYIAGGIPPKILPLLAASRIRDRFEDKGRFREYLAEIPLRVVIKEDLGLTGAVRYLRLHG